MYNFAKRIWPLNRSLTGKGNLLTLQAIKKEVKSLKIIKTKSGTKVFDWKIPLEWQINEAYIITPKGKKILNFKENNLYLVNYSRPIEKYLTYKKLVKKLHYIKKKPNSVPYVTSYYKKDWGFCISYKKFKSLDKIGKYKVVIKSKFIQGNLIYGQYYKKGKTNDEVLLSTNICHPSLANNELSGLVMCMGLAKWLSKKKKLNKTYRIVFLPETIGALTFLNKELSKLKKNVIGGFNIVCVGDERNYSFLPSRTGDTLSDKIAQKVLFKRKKNYKNYSWLDRGSDERQYCSPGVDLPIASIMRTKYGEYKEYHTSEDKLGSVVTPKGLKGSFNMFKDAILEFEKTLIPRTNIKGEPFFMKRMKGGLIESKFYSRKKFYGSDKKLMIDIFSYCDGTNSLEDIAKKVGNSIKKTLNLINFLKKRKILY